METWDNKARHRHYERRSGARQELEPICMRTPRKASDSDCDETIFAGLTYRIGCGVISERQRQWGSGRHGCILRAEQMSVIPGRQDGVI